MTMYAYAWTPPSTPEEEIALNKRIYGGMNLSEFYEAFVSERTSDREKLDTVINYFCADMVQQAFLNGKVSVMFFDTQIDIELIVFENHNKYRVTGYGYFIVDSYSLFDKLRDDVYCLMRANLHKHYKPLSFKYDENSGLSISLGADSADNQTNDGVEKYNG